jgi:hypothetical protein
MRGLENVSGRASATNSAVPSARRRHGLKWPPAGLPGAPFSTSRYPSEVETVEPMEQHVLDQARVRKSLIRAFDHP